MSIVTFYNGTPEQAPRVTRGARLGANALIIWNGKLLLERRRDSNTWGLIGGGVKKRETSTQTIVRETYEELGIRMPPKRFEKWGIYDNPGRIAAYRDGSVWRMVIVVFRAELSEEPRILKSAESMEVRFFTREELNNVNIAVTHADIVERWISEGK